MLPIIRLRAAGVCAVAAISLAVVPSPAGAQTSGPGSRTGRGPHVRVELTADRAAAAPGMRLGLKFQLDPDWHIYWRNPGDSGGPPEVAWTFPPGMMAAGIEWPAPERIDIGGLVNYGYHNTVVLPVAVAVAAGARIPPEFTVRATVRWMACANLCVPGQGGPGAEVPADCFGEWSGRGLEVGDRCRPRPGAEAGPRVVEGCRSSERGRVCRRRPDRIARGARGVLPARVEPGERLSRTSRHAACGRSPRGIAQVEPAHERPRRASRRSFTARRARVHD